MHFIVRIRGEFYSRNRITSDSFISNRQVEVSRRLEIMDDRVAIGTHRVKTSVSKYGSQQSNQQRTSLFVLAMDREWFGLKGMCFQGRRTGGGGERLDWRWKWRHRWTSPRFSDGCNETSPFNGKTPSHRALRFFIFTGRSFLCFIIVLNLFELQSFYIHQFRHSCVRVCVCV